MLTNIMNAFESHNIIYLFFHEYWLNGCCVQVHYLHDYLKMQMTYTSDHPGVFCKTDSRGAPRLTPYASTF